MTTLNTPILSSEGDRLVVRSPKWDRFTSLLVNQYSQERPEGLINFGVAESSLMHDELKEFLPRNLVINDLDFSYGDRLLGSSRLFTSLANFFNQRFDPLVPVKPEHIVAGNGLSAVIEQTTAVLCNPGDGFMVARPYYTGFDEDMTLRVQAKVVGVDVGPHPASPSTLDAFEHQLALFNQANEPTGNAVRAVMLCNPHNPLGFNYPRDTLVAYARFCEKHNLHLVSDEIYALTQFENPDIKDEEHVPFTSILAVDVLEEAGCNPARVHVLYGAAKDFGMNGARLGCIVSQHNPTVHKAFTGLGLQMKISSASDALWSAVLNDDVFLNTFVQSNQKRLAQTFAICRDFFRSHDIPYFGQPTAALFFWIDLGRFLREKNEQGLPLDTTQAKEDDLRIDLAKGGLFITPAYVYHGTSPGWFRFTFALRPDYLKTGLERFTRVLEKWKAR